MANQRTKSSEKKDARSRKVRNLSAKPLGARKAASVKGGKTSLQDIPITHIYDKSSPLLA
jgi:type VI protein secretion system component Hcp